MRSLLVVTCAQDLCLTRNLFRRITCLEGWRHFSHLHLHLDNNVSFEAARSLLSPAIPYSEQNIRVTRTTEINRWQTDRAEMMLSIYKMACSLNQDFVRIDPDLYICSSEFFRLLERSQSGISGKLMQLFLPAYLRGRRLDFIQGGATYWGQNGRAYLQDLRAAKIEAYRRSYAEVIEISDPKRRKEYEHFLCSPEDVVLTGALAMIAGIERAHLPGLQASTYDVMRDNRAKGLAYADFVAAYLASGALAYHFEGAHDGRRALMTEMLQRFYRDMDGFE
jgi:hypothetical protein